MLRPTLLIAAVSAAAPALADGLCLEWARPNVVGQLDVNTLREASGIAASAAGSRLYLINDGPGPLFYVTALDGGAPRPVSVAGFAPLDVEDIALGPCEGGTCLYLADIGDNGAWRPFVQIAIVDEREAFDDEIVPRRVITARYPDGPHDAEAIAMHPSGDLWLVTKARIGQGGPALVFRLSAEALAAGGELRFEALGEIPVTALTRLGPGLRRVVTAMDIAPDGRRLVLLTYDAAIELALGPDGALPGPGEWVEGRTHRALPIAQLIQAEAIAYAEDGRAVVYTTESVRGSPAPIVRQACL